MANELNRDALIIYLNDLRILETRKYQSEVTLEKVDDIYQSILYKDLKLTKETEVTKPINPTELQQAAQNVNTKGITIVIFILLIAGIASFFTGIISNIMILKILGICLFILSIPLIIVKSEYSGKRISYNEYNQICKKYQDDLEYYEQVTRENEIIAEKNRAIKKKHKDEAMTARDYREKIKMEIHKLKSELTKAYSINIIPLQFRNIQGVLFLYDYISTCGGGLSEALIQCSLDAIKKKMDEMIRLQEESIIQAEQHHHDQMEMNQKILDEAQKSAKNSEECKKYEEIRALNSSQALNYEKGQYAYQKANFWLNYYNSWRR